MIDITVANNQVMVDMKEFHSFNQTDNLVEMIALILERAKYSGETISLWKLVGDKKVFVQEWY